jgi:glycosyltransferase involved in cell wall biosynthesis
MQMKNKLVCMLRVKDGILFVHNWLNNIEKLVDEIVVVDNGSTDGTLEILRNHPKVVSIDETIGFDEGRDKILVYNRAKERNPDWILWIDIDEIFEERLTRKKLDKMMSSKLITKYWFRRFHLHNDEKHFEAAPDKILITSSPDRILWKNQPSGYFIYERIHCALIRGIRGGNWISPYRIRHYGGNLHKDYLKKKTEIYLSVDPGSADKYIKHRDQEVPTWEWFEYREKPLVVISQNVLFNAIFAFSLVQRKINELFKKVLPKMNVSTQ